MTPQVKRILDEVNKLTPYERAEIIDLILDSFDNPVDKEVEKAWVDEAKRRLAAYRNGETGLKSEEEVFRELSNEAMEFRN